MVALQELACIQYTFLNNISGTFDLKCSCAAVTALNRAQILLKCAAVRWHTYTCIPNLTEDPYNYFTTLHHVPLSGNGC